MQLKLKSALTLKKRSQQESNYKIADIQDWQIWGRREISIASHREEVPGTYAKRKEFDVPLLNHY